MGYIHYAISTPRVDYCVKNNMNKKIRAIQVKEFKQNPELLFNMYIFQKSLYERKKKPQWMDVAISLKIDYLANNTQEKTYDNHLSYVDWEHMISNDITITYNHKIAKNKKYDNNMICNLIVDLRNDEIKSMKKIFENIRLSDFIVFMEESNIYMSIVDKKSFCQKYTKIK